MKRIIFILLIIIITACNNSTDNPENAGAQPASAILTDSIQTDFNAADSIEIYFYKDPAKQKEFTRLFVADPSEIAVLVQDLGSIDTSIKECAHDGKIFFYRNGDVYKTVYMATADTCRYLAYAVNAKPYFTPINDMANRLIDTLKLRAQ